MIRRLFATALAVALSATSALAAEGTFDKTLSVGGTPTVSVSTGSGHIHVTLSADNRVHIIGHVRAQKSWFSSGDPDAAVKHILEDPPIIQNGSLIRIGQGRDHEHYNNVFIDYDIATPRGTALSTGTGSGEIQISGISGPVRAESGSGSLHLALHNSTQVTARTGSGQIFVESATGAVIASTGSGSIDVSGNVINDWKLSTGSGSIHVQLPSNARFSLDASTGSGSILTDQPVAMQGSMNRHHVTGNVNGGGPTLRASTGSGSISVNNLSAR